MTVQNPEPLPPITPELAVLSILVETHMRTLKPRARERFVDTLCAVLNEREGSVPMLRPGTQVAHFIAVRRKGALWLRRVVGMVERRI
jgi:hypothetical protein